MSSGARIADVRYGRYEGERRGRLAAVWALARVSALQALGKRRGWLAKALPVALTLIAFAPAFIVLGVRALFADRIQADLSQALPFDGYFGGIALIILAFSALVAPELVCPDRRDRVLDLYFSTAVSRSEYVVGKLVAATLPMGLVTLCPVAFLYLGNVLFAVHPLGYFGAHARDAYRIVAASLVICIYYALLSLAVASLTPRFSFAIGGYLGLMILSGAIAGTLVGGLGGSELFHLIALPAIPIALAAHLFPSGAQGDTVSTGAWALAWLGVCAVCVLVLVRRYRSRG